MMINIEVGYQLMIAKPHGTKWGWMLYAQAPQGQAQAIGIYTDPAKLLVKIGEMLFSRAFGVELDATTDPFIAKRQYRGPKPNADDDDPDWEIVNPNVMASVFFEGDSDNRTSWSTEEEKAVAKDERERLKTITALAK